MRYDLTGRKEIMNFLRLTHWSQVEERMRRGLPVTKEAGEFRWLACSTELEAWICREASEA
jgi:hypothetical protein